MDTKWKNRKRIISFLVFLLGVSLTLGSLADILRKKPGNVNVWELDRVLARDYQEEARFRAYVEDRLQDFLIMATGGEGLWGFWGYEDGTYYGDGYGYRFHGEYGYGYSEFLSEALQEEIVEQQDASLTGTISGEELANYLESLKSMQEGYLELLDVMDNEEDSKAREAFRAELEIYQDEMRNLMESLENYLPNRLPGEQIKPLTDEQKQKIAAKYHDSIKGDRNLLYTIAYDGKVLYGNYDFSGTGSDSGKEQDSASAGQSDSAGRISAFEDIVLPEGYNFLLYFDGEKVRIQKDGREVDVYGDGYFREDSDWYVPGYANFQTDGTTKKAAVCMAVAADPVLYTEGSYGKGGALQYDNSLYWMNVNLKIKQQSIRQSLICLAIGLVLLGASFLCRKSRLEAAEGIARFQAKIWMECKILCLSFVTINYGYGIWEELFYAHDYNLNYVSAAGLGGELIRSIPPAFWILLFWGLWLLKNDLRHNKKIWRKSLTVKLLDTFSAKTLDQPLSRKMTRRNRSLFLAGLLYAILMLEQVVLVDNLWKGEHVRAIVCLLAALETVLFLTVLYRAVVKNVQMARDVEAISDRIAQIRDGDYGEEYGDGLGRASEPSTETGSYSGTLDGSTGDGTAWAEHERGSEPQKAGSGHDLQPVMDQLEDIRHGMAKAVDEQMKSQRMKVELIANVSHDIKTPLTSIISYVEILKQEDGLPEYVKDYIKILDEKSKRLKNMVTDVFAVSKAASGELPVQMEELDFGKLLRQTLADMEEQIQGSNVTFRTQIPETPVMISADGQRLYRVFQNLFQNACKYSLPGSRVYVALHTDGSLAVASVKNTSSQELEKGRDFTERFVRGDASRTDGGSGLGLSIAQSFTEACGGEFSWETDADLFIVRVAFQTLQGKPGLAKAEAAPTEAANP